MATVQVNAVTVLKRSIFQFLLYCLNDQLNSNCCSRTAKCKNAPNNASGSMPLNTHFCSDELLVLWLVGVRELLSEAQVHCVSWLRTSGLLVVL